MADQEIDLLIIILVSESQSNKLMANLNKNHFYFTVIDSSSSLFHEPTNCLLMGLNHTRLEEVDGLIQKYCKPYRKFIPAPMRSFEQLGYLPTIESLEGGATLYGMPVEYFEQI